MGRCYEKSKDCPTAVAGVDKNDKFRREIGNLFLMVAGELCCQYSVVLIPMQGELLGTAFVIGDAY